MSGIRFELITGYSMPVMRIYYFNKRIGIITYGVGIIKDVTAIGYNLDPEFRNKGIMSDALRFYCDNCGLDVIQACVKQSNVWSIQLLARCGFEKVSEYEREFENIFVFKKQLKAVKSA